MKSIVLDTERGCPLELWLPSEVLKRYLSSSIFGGSSNPIPTKKEEEQEPSNNRSNAMDLIFGREAGLGPTSVFCTSHSFYTSLFRQMESFPKTKCPLSNPYSLPTHETSPNKTLLFKTRRNLDRFEKNASVYNQFYRRWRTFRSWFSRSTDRRLRSPFHSRNFLSTSFASAFQWMEYYKIYYDANAALDDH